MGQTRSVLPRPAHPLCTTVWERAPHGPPLGTRRQRRSTLAQGRRAGRGQGQGVRVSRLLAHGTPRPKHLALHPIGERGVQLRVAHRPNRLLQAPPQVVPETRSSQETGTTAPFRASTKHDHASGSEGRCLRPAGFGARGQTSLSGVLGPWLRATAVHRGCLEKNMTDGPVRGGNEGKSKCPHSAPSSQDSLPRPGCRSPDRARGPRWSSPCRAGSQAWPSWAGPSGHTGVM